MTFSMPLIQSNFTLCSLGGLDGSSFLPMKNAAMPNGTFIRNSQCHDATERIHPAIVGPAAVAIAMAIALRASPPPKYIARIYETGEGNVYAHDTGGSNPLKHTRD